VDPRTLSALLFLLLGCTPAPAGPDAARPEPARPDAAFPADAVAIVNGVAIPRARLDAEIARLPPEHQDVARGLRGRVSLVDRLIDQELIDQEARRRGLDQRPDVATRLQASRQQILREALLADLAVEPVTDLEVRAALATSPHKPAEEVRAALEAERRQAATARVLEQIHSSATIVRPEPRAE